MTTILITGFGRFHGAPFNPSCGLARELVRIRRPAFAGTRRIAHIFPTSYAAVDRQLPMLLADHRPDAVVMFGLAMRTKHIRIELQAANRMLALFPDASGYSPDARSIRPRGPTRLCGRAPFLSMLAAARGHGLDARLSRDAGRYVCNYSYWRAIEAAAMPNGPAIVVFVHVPNVRGPRFANLIGAAEAILAAVVSGL